MLCVTQIMNSTEGANTSIDSNKTPQAEICRIRRTQMVSDLPCPIHVHQLRVEYESSQALWVCGLLAKLYGYCKE